MLCCERIEGVSSLFIFYSFFLKRKKTVVIVLRCMITVFPTVYVGLRPYERHTRLLAKWVDSLSADEEDRLSARYESLHPVFFHIIIYNDGTRKENRDGEKRRRGGGVRSHPS
ncbi:hypothetical protein IE53DRAFT_177216 [Violaceomyces palustris]|uniref:Uncharacterized protein n=1 Tax=Violaceomyces palustris TaxID=1673888 RepID=A0ACD0P5I1_9BASI|nr:hypothetical protein IE53DRAFT_177216 [Violaceomyces palustris]